jgi:hypothetical protein
MAASQPNGDARRLRRVRALVLLHFVLLGLCLTACAPGSSGPPGPSGTLTLILTAGPVCPVERIPPDPACLPRPVAGAEVAVLEGDREIARGASDMNGRLSFTLPHGRYILHPLSEGTFPIPPADQVVDIGPQPLELALDYDTGIR